VCSFSLRLRANPTVLTSIPDDGRQVGDFRPTGLGEKSNAGGAPLYVLRQAALAVLDEAVWHLVSGRRGAGRSDGCLVLR